MVSEQRTGIGLLQGVAMYTGALLGAGVLTFPALAARRAGPASLLAWAGLVLLSVPLASTFAALAGRYPDAGGVATFAARAFGPRWAAVTGWWFYFTVPVGIPVLGLFGGAYVAAATGGGQTTRLAVAVALVAVAVAANWVGLRLSGRLQLILAALLAALLIVAIATSAPHARTANLYPFAPHGWLAVGGAAVLLVWSFAGWETVTHLAAEFADPARDLRRATAAALTLIGTLYLGLAAVSVLVLGPRLEQVDAPLALLLARGVGGSIPAGTVAAVVAVVVTLGAMNTYVASAARLGAALGRDGALPGWLAKGGQAGEVPRRSLATVAALTSMVLVGMLVTGADGHVQLLATTSCLAAIYTIGCAAGVRLLPRGSLGRRAAVAATVLVAGLLLLAGPFLAWPLLLALGALTTRRALDRRGRAHGLAAGATHPRGRRSRDDPAAAHAPARPLRRA
jgi:amino acid efflux transporter